MCDSNIIFHSAPCDLWMSLCPCDLWMGSKGHCLSVSLSCYLLLNDWAEFNQTCYMTSPSGMGVQKQHNFSVHLSLHLSICHTISNINMEPGYFAMACHQLDNLVCFCFSGVRFQNSFLHNRGIFYHQICEPLQVTLIEKQIRQSN